jgi:hypothetical protein
MKIYINRKYYVKKTKKYFKLNIFCKENKKWNIIKTKDSKKERERCSICTERKITSCNLSHNRKNNTCEKINFFCGNCITVWFFINKKKTCPFCRYDVVI